MSRDTYLTSLVPERPARGALGRREYWRRERVKRETEGEREKTETEGGERKDTSESEDGPQGEGGNEDRTGPCRGLRNTYGPRYSPLWSLCLLSLGSRREFLEGQEDRPSTESVSNSLFPTEHDITSILSSGYPP